MQTISQTVHRGLLATILVLAIPHLADAQTRVNSGINLFSPQQDAQIGAQSAAQANQQLPLLANSSVTDLVNTIGQRLAAQAPGPDFQYRFKVVNASDLNAFALPGGYVYVNRGVIESAHSDSEIAGVLAHEIAHVALRHGTHNASKAYLTQTGVGILAGLLGGHIGQNTAQVLNVVGGVGLNATFLRYSREAESQADILGAQIMSRAGYNPYAMASFFRTLQQADHSRTVGWLSDHPNPASRIQSVEHEAALLHASRNTPGRSARLAKVQDQLSGMRPARTLAQIGG